MHTLAMSSTPRKLVSCEYLPRIHFDVLRNEQQRIPSETCLDWKKVHGITRHAPAVVLVDFSFSSSVRWFKLTKMLGSPFLQHHSYG